MPPVAAGAESLLRSFVLALALAAAPARLEALPCALRVAGLVVPGGWLQWGLWARNSAAMVGSFVLWPEPVLCGPDDG